MLVLTRIAGESLVIGGNVEVFLIRSDKGKARIGIRAPREVEVHRREVFDRLQAEKKENDGNGR